MGFSHLEFLVEERSMGEALAVLLPQIADVSYKIRTFDGKPDLLKKLPQRLAGYRHWPPEHLPGIVVVVDRDDDDCVELVGRLDTVARRAGFDCGSLQEAGHHRGGLAKGRAAREIALHMDVEENRSKSFQKFRDGVRLLVQGGTDAQA